MMNWKSFLLATVIGTTLMAQYQRDIPVKGKLVLKDTEGKELELKDDTKLDVQIVSPNSLEKLVLKKQYQIKLIADKQEIIFNAEQVAGDSRNYLVGGKDENKQPVNIQCTSEIKVKSEDGLTFEKGQLACVKTSGCKSYVLGTDKKFKMSDTTVCVGKKEVEISKENANFVEVMTCRLYDVREEDQQKLSAKFTFTKAMTDIKEKHVRQAASECK